MPAGREIEWSSKCLAQHSLVLFRVLMQQMYLFFMLVPVINFFVSFFLCKNHCIVLGKKEKYSSQFFI